MKRELISNMVSQLRCLDVDLGDERDVLRKLSDLGFSSGDIVAYSDEVIEETRRQGPEEDLGMMQAELAANTKTAPHAGEIGKTVADARRLAKSAKRVFIFYRAGPREWETHCIGLNRAVFLRSILHKEDDQAMPCRMAEDGEPHLLIGVEVA
jgi:hypothetical protein